MSGDGLAEANPFFSWVGFEAALMPRRHLLPKTPLTARNADRYDLYQRAVLVVPKVPFLAQTFEGIAGRRAVSLREDFCGTALLCAEWVGAKRGRTAVGIDIDPEPLAWGAKHNLLPLGTRASLVRLLQQDARDPCRGPFDVSVALNFSYFVFQTREELRRYFAGVRRSMAPDGIFVLDAFGGYDSWRCLSERRRGADFTYVWEQAPIDPIDHTTVSHIHFEFRDGSRLKRAFTYHWRLWTLPEIREVLAEAGCSRSWVYWVDPGADGRRTHTSRPRDHVAQAPVWAAYIVAQR
jgi:SAM-dependent methyltransferase